MQTGKGRGQDDRKKRMPCSDNAYSDLICGCAGRLPGDAGRERGGEPRRGLPEDAVIQPLADGKTQIIELPDKWQQTEKWSKDRWIFEADVELESIETGNLPVIEMAQRSMTQDELEKLAEYFADGQELYKPVPTTKDVFQDKLDRDEQCRRHLCSLYDRHGIWHEKGMAGKGLAAAPETADQTPEKAEVTFGPDSRIREPMKRWKGQDPFRRKRMRCRSSFPQMSGNREAAALRQEITMRIPDLPVNSNGWTETLCFIRKMILIWIKACTWSIRMCQKQTASGRNCWMHAQPG